MNETLELCECGQSDKYHHGGPDFDLCACGDYRHQHENNRICSICRYAGPTFCGWFRLVRENHPFVAAAAPAPGHQGSAG